MRKLIGILSGLILLILVGNLNSLFADEFFNSIGIKYNHLMPKESDQFSTSNGFGLYGIFDLNPKSQSPERVCFEGFIDFLTLKTDADLLSEGELSIVSPGVSLLYAKRTETSTFYLGGGLTYYTNKFKISSQAEDNIYDLADWYFWYYYGEVLLEFDYEEKIENTMGFHLKGGIEIKLSDNLSFSGEIKKTFIKADASGEIYALTFDGVNYWEYTDETEDELDLGAFSIGVGLSLQF